MASGHGGFAVAHRCGQSVALFVQAEQERLSLSPPRLPLPEVFGLRSTSEGWTVLSLRDRFELLRFEPSGAFVSAQPSGSPDAVDAELLPEAAGLLTATPRGLVLTSEGGLESIIDPSTSVYALTSARIDGETFIAWADDVRVHLAALDGAALEERLSIPDTQFAQSIALLEGARGPILVMHTGDELIALDGCGGG
jgi:hypothetical protein